MALSMTPERWQAHALLDLLPDDKLHVIRSLLEAAPVEEEEITAETAVVLDRAKASLACGKGIAHDDILREFGLK